MSNEYLGQSFAKLEVYGWLVENSGCTSYTYKPILSHLFPETNYRDNVRIFLWLL